MRYNLGDIIYDGSGNGKFCTFIKGRIRQIIAPTHYVVEILEDCGSIWDKPANDIAKLGSLHNCLERNAFKTYREAKTNLYKDMGFKYNRDFISAYFDNDR